MWTQFQGFFQESCFFNEYPGTITQKLRNLRVRIPGNFQLLGIVTWKFRNHRVMIHRDFSIAGYHNLEIAIKNTIFMKNTPIKNNFCEYLCKNKNILKIFQGLNLGTLGTIDS